MQEKRALNFTFLSSFITGLTGTFANTQFYDAPSLLKPRRNSEEISRDSLLAYIKQTEMVSRLPWLQDI